MKSLASGSTNNRQDYLSIRIPNKGDVPVIEYEGSRLCINVGDSLSTESNLAKIAEMNSEETRY
ncbi:hypothetical protein IL997_001408 [Listeria monocytogenes]|nr:hypothetical protein [Listeria monocytogenes serotype 1/2a]EGL8585569.1 hypothetical protein [Listeria monocytogenes]EGL8588445.1 hypothetical protein [Listeria monocytogenes]HAA6882861.1 hypothetical protein [Listeria monocytogenes]